MVSVRGFEPPTNRSLVYCLFHWATRTRKGIAPQFAQSAIAQTATAVLRKDTMLLRFILRTLLPVENHGTPKNGSERNRTAVQTRLMLLKEAIPELGFEPRQTQSKCVDLPVSRFWSRSLGWDLNPRDNSGFAIHRIRPLCHLDI